MKKQLITILLVSFFIGSSSYVLSTSIDQGDSSVTKEISFVSTVFSTTVEDGYTSIIMPNATGSVITPGHPELPKITLTIMLPFGSTLESVKSQSDRADQTFLLDERVNPVSYPEPLDPRISMKEYQKINEQIYLSSSLYPSSSLDVSFSAGLIENEMVNILSLTWYPITYIPVENTIFFNQDLTVTITYTPPDNPLQATSENDLIIIGPQEFADAAQTLVNHKNNHGVRTMFTSVEYIHQNYEGRDHAGTLNGGGRWLDETDLGEVTGYLSFAHCSPSTNANWVSGGNRKWSQYSRNLYRQELMCETRVTSHMEHRGVLRGCWATARDYYTLTPYGTMGEYLNIISGLSIKWNGSRVWYERG